MKASVWWVNKRQLIVDKQHRNEDTRHKDQEPSNKKQINLKHQISNWEQLKTRVVIQIWNLIFICIFVFEIWCLTYF